MRRRLDDVATGLLVVCALAVTALALRHQFRKPRNILEPRRLSHWTALAREGHWRGPTDAKVIIIEFADFQCTACERVRFAIDSVLARHPQVALVFRHYPLRMTHLDSDAAANAAECAGSQGRFFQFASKLFDRQNYIGKVPWRDFASESGVGDLDAFDRCVRANRFGRKVERDAAVGDSIGVFATPTLIVNGVVGTGAVTTRELERYVESFLRP